MSNLCVANLSIKGSCIPDTDGTLFQFVVVDIDKITSIKDKMKSYPDHIIEFEYRNTDDYIKCRDISITLFEGETYLKCFKKFTKNSDMKSYDIIDVLEDFCKKADNKEKFVEQLTSFMGDTDDAIVEEGWNAFKGRKKNWDDFLTRHNIKNFRKTLECGLTPGMDKCEYLNDPNSNDEGDDTDSEDYDYLDDPTLNNYSDGGDD